jgi:hypothetical protein
MYRPEDQAQVYLLLGSLSRCVVETLFDEEKVGRAKRKWPARWWSTLYGILNKCIYNFNKTRFIVSIGRI